MLGRGCGCNEISICRRRVVGRPVNLVGKETQSLLEIAMENGSVVVDRSWWVVVAGVVTVADGRHGQVI